MSVYYIGEMEAAMSAMFVPPQQYICLPIEQFFDLLENSTLAHLRRTIIQDFVQAGICFACWSDQCLLGSAHAGIYIDI